MNATLISQFISELENSVSEYYFTVNGQPLSFMEKPEFIEWAKIRYRRESALIAKKFKPQLTQLWLPLDETIDGVIDDVFVAHFKEHL